jgi:flagellin
MISFQTNIDALVAQQNLNTNSMFQSQTIQQLTSGYRINSSGDDAAGLAQANQDSAEIAQITQGVANGNNGTAQLQIMDGGMSNISQILDRLQTLATESASSTFTSSRTAVNAEFQTDIQELNRQAQAIGLNTGGTFAQNLDVYLGGGGGSTAAAVSADGQVNIDLSKATVDAQSLGLSGMQAVANSGNPSLDLSDGSTTSVSTILGAAAGNALSAPNTTDFVFSGAGYSDASAVKVAVNTSGVTDINTLITAINNAIQNAGNGSTPAATAFKNAGVVASVSTNGDGQEALAFTSSTSAFQVSAGDQTANALMGNFSSDATGNTISTATTNGTETAATGTTFAGDAQINLQIDGAGMSAPVVVKLNVTASTTVDSAISSLETAVNTNPTLEAAGVTMSGLVGGTLNFTNTNGGAFGVQVTGDTGNLLGLGSFVSSPTDTNAVSYSTITGNAYAPAAAATGTQEIGISLNGAEPINATVSLDGAASDATGAHASVASGTTASAAETLDVNGQAVAIANGATLATIAKDINTTAGVGATATIASNGALVITNTTLGSSHALTFGGAGATDLGLAASTSNGTDATLGNVVNQLNQQFTSNSSFQAAGLQASDNAGALEISSNNGSYFRTTGSVADIGFGTYAGDEDISGLAAAATATLSNVVASGTSATGGISFTAMQYGSDTQSVTISANNSAGALQTQTITLANNATLGNTSGQSIDDAIAYINQQLQSSDNTTMQQIVAVKGTDDLGNQTVNFVSNLNSFSVGVGTSVNGYGLNGGTAQTEASQSNGNSATVSIDSLSAAQAAVNAVTNAVTALGNAQATIGKGEDQLNYAVSLGQSQITNISAAESQIRDANVAQEAANMTKASVLVQATVAAMAQANQEPQAVLSLLKQ